MTAPAETLADNTHPLTSEEDPPRDEEGLLYHYDVILVGTGLVQSILASALARAGKTVLHCDAADYYGELDTVWTLPYLRDTLKESLQHSAGVVEENNEEGIQISPKGSLDSLQIHSMAQKTEYPIVEGTEVSTPYGIGRVAKISTSKTNGHYTTLAISLTNWKLRNGQCQTVYTRLPTQIPAHKTMENYLATNHDILNLKARQAQMILHEHSRSFALDMTPALLYASGAAVDGLLKSNVADYLEFKSLEGLYWLDGKKLEKVPCSKNDVFASPLLTPMDKRRLMKFLQLALDYATSEADKDERAQKEAEEASGQEEVQSLNERHLNQGRSLARPQNKAVNTDEILLLQQCISEGMDFDTYLREKQRLSPKLTALVRYALALESGQQSWNAREGMKSLCHHMQALGRFGTTAFLVPLYGSGELSQAFCRSAAVYGATYLLRRTATRVVTSDDTVQGVVLGGDGESQTTRKQVSCSHVIVPQEAMMKSSSRRVLRRISILPGKVIGSAASSQQRHAIIIPPGSLGNDNTIHCLLLDEHINVAPHVPSGCSVVHLTTMVDSGDDEVDDSIMKKAMDAILESSEDDLDEIFHVSMSYSLYEEDESHASDSVHVVCRPRPGLEVDPAFAKAKQIFSKICPGAEFLAMADEVDKAVKERIGDFNNEEDDERMVLESAMGMLSTAGNEEESQEPTSTED